MRIMAIDTSAIAGSVAIWEDGIIKAQSYLHNKLTHSQTIMVMVDDVFKKADMNPSDIDYYAVSVGPGSFTGLRIGVATVKGLAHATEKKVIPINTLDALSAAVPFFDGVVVPIMDARREQVYTAKYKNMVCISEPNAEDIYKCISSVDKYDNILFMGDAVQVYKEQIVEKLGDRAKFAPSFALIQNASVVAELASNKIDIAVMPHDVVPFYIRKSQAERELEEKENITKI